jgi:PEGA domain
MLIRGCGLDEATGCGFADRASRSNVCAVNQEEPSNPEHWSHSLVSPNLGGSSTPPPPPARSDRLHREQHGATVHTLPGTGAGPNHRPNLRALSSNVATQRFFTEPDPNLVEPLPEGADEAEEIEAEPLPTLSLQPFAAEEPASARMAKLILPPPPPQFSNIRRGEALLPERSNDPSYYPGLVNDPEPLPRLQREWPAWAKYAAAGVGLFLAGLIARGLLSGPKTWNAVIDVTPPDARVQVDGKAIEGSTSPRTVEGLISGDHVVLVEQPGYVSHRQVFTMEEADRRVVVSLDREPPPKKEEPAAEPAPAEHEPAAKAEPVAAAPEPEPPAPLEDLSKLSKRELAKKRRSELRAARVAERYRARKAGAAESKTSSSSKFGAVSASASAGSMGLLKVNSTPWSEVYVDKKHVGHTPLLGLQLPAGRHVVELKNPDTGAKKKLRIKLKPGEVVTKIEKLGR